MKTIYKYTLSGKGRAPIRMPKGGQILSVQPHYGVLSMWALVNQDPNADEEVRNFVTLHTGDMVEDAEIPKGMKLQFIATAHQGGLVYHVFEEVKDFFASSLIKLDQVITDSKPIPKYEAGTIRGLGGRAVVGEHKQVQKTLIFSSTGKLKGKLDVSGHVFDVLPGQDVFITIENRE